MRRSAAPQRGYLRVKSELELLNYLPEKDGLELVHTRIGEKDGRVIQWHDSGGRDEQVLVSILEEIDERVTAFLGRPVIAARSHRAHRTLAKMLGRLQAKFTPAAAGR